MVGGTLAAGFCGKADTGGGDDEATFFTRKHHLNGFCYGTIAHDFGDGMSRTQLQDLQTKMMDAKAGLTTVIDRSRA